MSISLHSIYAEQDQSQQDRTRALTHPPRRRALALSAMLISLAALSIAGCGSASKPVSSSSSSASASVPTPIAASSATGAVAGGGSSAKRDARGKAATHQASGASTDAGTGIHSTVRPHNVVTRGAVTERPVAGTGGATHNDDNPGRADAGRTSGHGVEQVAGQLNPCTLVSESSAEAIVGGPLDAPLEAPLGPTCIYHSPGYKTSITLTVQVVNFAQLKPHMKHSKPLIVGGHPAICGSYGRPTTFVPLGHDEVLTITAPCAMGKQFAAAALPRLVA